MFPFDGKYLKVLTPVTVDGLVPFVDEDTGIAKYKESHHPLTARKYLEQQNEDLPRFLRKKIIEVDSDAEKPTLGKSEQAIVDKKAGKPALAKKEEEVDELTK